MDRKLSYPLYHPLFIFGIASYVLVRISRSQLDLFPEFIHSHWTDFLCLPLILTIILVVVRKIRKDPFLIIPFKWVIVLIVQFSLLFEWILPSQSPIYVGDIKDVFAYIIGGGCFYLTQKTLFVA